MHRITLLTVGSPKSSWVKEGREEYVCRLLGSIDFSILPVQPSKSRDPLRQREEESQLLLSALEKQDGDVWVLDESGKELSSREFASALAHARDLGTKITFVLGGAYGLNDAVRSRADRIIALSKMTFPHELCQLIFLEQLYRAVQIQKGSGYHH
ncbi:MAG: 23S rRNA (pseudouridine(1915)-N(3))-methyltransferase RlmH [Candidatus Peribacteraceae bacterium]|nr:23S rRNA (pseudouridine(1915)-N(3))-methyltransferase RlmH [Candidatus Peribacteraceae bacterium]